MHRQSDAEPAGRAEERGDNRHCQGASLRVERGYNCDRQRTSQQQGAPGGPATCRAGGRVTTSPRDRTQDVPKEATPPAGSKDKINTIDYVDFLYAKFCAQQDLPVPPTLESEEIEWGLGLAKLI